MRPCVLLWPILAGLVLFAPDAGAACGAQRAGAVKLPLPGRTLVDVSINGAPERMVLDTGAQQTAVTPDLVAALRLHRDRRRSLLMGVGGSDVSQNALVDRLELGGLQFSQLSVGVTPLTRLGATPDTQPVGLIGADLLHEYDLDIDLPDRAITFYRPDECGSGQPPWPETAEALPATISGRRLVLLTVALNDGDVTALFDTGAGTELVSRDTALNVGVYADDMDRGHAGRGYGAGAHEFDSRLHSFASLRVGSELFRNVPMNIVDFHQDRIDMLLGNGYMRSRRFYLSYAHDALFVQRRQPAPHAAAPVAMAVPAPDRAPARGDMCQPSPALLDTLSPALLVVVSEPRVDAPVEAARVDGCVGMMFRLGANGAPKDLKVVTEVPGGLGLGAYVTRALAAARYEPTGEAGWHYVLQWVHLGPGS